MSAVGAGLDLVLVVGMVLLVARFVVDWVLVLGGGRGGLAGSAGHVVRSLTDPVLVPLRRVLPPVRLGTVAIDLALPVLLVAVQLLRPVVRSL